MDKGLRNSRRYNFDIYVGSYRYIYVYYINKPSCIVIKLPRKCQDIHGFRWSLPTN